MHGTAVGLGEHGKAMGKLQLHCQHGFCEMQHDMKVLYPMKWFVCMRSCGGNTSSCGSKGKGHR